MTYKEPAFPFHESGESGQRTGMTLRDYFAAKAMQAFIAGDGKFADSNKQLIADCSYDMADAMLKERKYD